MALEQMLQLIMTIALMLEELSG